MADILSSFFSPSGQYDLGSPNSRVGNVFATAPSVTQATSVSTGVTINATQGKIVMFAGTIAAANGIATFTVTNSYVTANSTISVAVSDFAGAYVTNGIPIVCAKTVAAGSFIVNVINLHATNATGTNSLTLSFEVVG